MIKNDDIYNEEKEPNDSSYTIFIFVLAIIFVFLLVSCSDSSSGSKSYPDDYDIDYYDTYPKSSEW